jgi:hypothetical protein
MASFEVTLYGQFWVTPEAPSTSLLWPFGERHVSVINCLSEEEVTIRSGCGIGVQNKEGNQVEGGGNLRREEEASWLEARLPLSNCFQRTTTRYGPTGVGWC